MGLTAVYRWVWLLSTGGFDCCLQVGLTAVYRWVWQIASLEIMQEGSLSISSHVLSKTAVNRWVWQLASSKIMQEESNLSISSPVLSKTAVYRWVWQLASSKIMQEESTLSISSPVLSKTAICRCVWQIVPSQEIRIFIGQCSERTYHLTYTISSQLDRGAVMDAIDAQQRLHLNQWVTKRCCLSWRRRIWAQMGVGRGCGLRGLTQWVQLCTWSPDKLWRSSSIFNLWSKQTGLRFYVAVFFYAGGATTPASGRFTRDRITS